MAGGTFKKHPTSGALLLNPLRQLQRCTCCGECEYAIRAEPCWQELEDCEPTIPPLWFCVESKCFGIGPTETLGQIKTPVTFLYTAPGDVERCYQTVPSSVILVSKLDEEIQAELITDTELECLDLGCGSAECGAPENTCDCVCRSLKQDFPFETDCCMSRYVEGVAPWTFTYRRTITRTKVTETRGPGSPYDDCLGDDCRGSAECTYDFREWEIDFAELGVPIHEQGCTKTVPLRFRNPIAHYGYIDPEPFPFPCCGEPNSGSNTWSAAGELIVDPPKTVPLDVAVLASDIFTHDGCVSKSIVTTTTEGDCTFYRRETVSELWSFGQIGDDCICQGYEREVDIVEYTFFPASDEMTRRLCAQCTAAEAM